MNLQGIVSVSGKPGLWKALAQNKTGFILESLDGNKTKLVVNLSTAKLAALDEITIFSYDQDILLKDVLERIKNAASVPDAKADGTKLRAFFREVAPDHDEEKVYASDMKKIITWFGILKGLPQFDEEPAQASEGESANETAHAPKPVAEKTKHVAAKAKPVSKGKVKASVVMKKGA